MNAAPRPPDPPINKTRLVRLQMGSRAFFHAGEFSAFGMQVVVGDIIGVLVEPSTSRGLCCTWNYSQILPQI